MQNFLFNANAIQPTVRRTGHCHPQRGNCHTSCAAVLGMHACTRMCVCVCVCAGSIGKAATATPTATATAASDNELQMSSRLPLKRSRTKLRRCCWCDSDATSTTTACAAQCARSQRVPKPKCTMRAHTRVSSRVHDCNPIAVVVVVAVVVRCG